MKIYLNIPMLEYNLFKTIENKVITKDNSNTFTFVTTIPMNEASLTMSNAKGYTKYISSAFKVIVNGSVYYFYFRNQMVNGEYTMPSSIEIFSQNPFISVYKSHIFTSVGKNYTGILPQSVDDFSTDEDMKNAIKLISSEVGTAFFTILEKEGIL